MEEVIHRKSCSLALWCLSERLCRGLYGFWDKWIHRTEGEHGYIDLFKRLSVSLYIIEISTLILGFQDVLFYIKL